MARCAASRPRRHRRRRRAPAPVSASRPRPHRRVAGRLVWSGQIAAEATGSSSASATARPSLPIAARKVPFDVDLGPASAGTVCASTPAATSTRRGRRPDARIRTGRAKTSQLELPSMTEVRSRRSTPASARTMARVLEGPARLRPRLRRRPGQALLYVETISSSAPSARQPGGHAAPRPRHRCRSSSTARAWPSPGASKADRDAPAYELRIDTVGDDHVRLDSASGGDCPPPSWLALVRARALLLASLVRRRPAVAERERFHMAGGPPTPEPLVTKPPRPARRRSSTTRRSAWTKTTSTRSTARRPSQRPRRPRHGAYRPTTRR